MNKSISVLLLSVLGLSIAQSCVWGPEGSDESFDLTSLRRDNTDYVVSYDKNNTVSDRSPFFNFNYNRNFFYFHANLFLANFLCRTKLFI